MADRADIIRALFDHMALLDTPLPISYPEPATTFVPPADGKYLEVAFSPNQEKWHGLGGGRIDQGLLQVTVVWPPRDGIINPTRVIDDIVDHFAFLTVMTYGTATVRVSRQPRWVTPMSQPDKARTPVMIPWTATG